MTLLESLSVCDTDQARRRRTLFLAVVLFLGSTTFLTAVQRSDVLVGILRWEYLAGSLVVVSALVAVGDGGLWRAWAVTFALAAGFGIHLGGIGVTGKTPGLFFRVVWAAIVGVVTATTLGVLGGSAGLGIRRLSAKGGRQ
ncbi:hypothetical protein ACH9L7_18040 (plasmid) [Haloferax sp. S1W]|uniref:hypothetical protein n=1 Tax=Haloferax sp. S1W TaxID=3377110 RepID=UPI0037CBA954